MLSICVKLFSNNTDNSVTFIVRGNFYIPLHRDVHQQFIRIFYLHQVNHLLGGSNALDDYRVTVVINAKALLLADNCLGEVRIVLISCTQTGSG